MLTELFRFQLSLKELHEIHTWSLAGSFCREENLDLYMKNEKNSEYAGLWWGKSCNHLKGQ
jgi:hypothetical protein